MQQPNTTSTAILPGGSIANIRLNGKPISGNSKVESNGTVSVELRPGTHQFTVQSDGVAQVPGSIAPSE